MSPSPRPADLPLFERPPVTEVVLGLQFATLESVQTVHIGLLWNLLRDRYPKVTEQAPLAPVFETFGFSNLQQNIEVRFEIAPQLPRFWFETTSGEHLLQFQRDRLLHNWRRKADWENEYPLYEKLREMFKHELRIVEEFLASNGLGTIRPNQCEVSYINTIRLPDGSNPHQALARITPLWSPPPGEGTLENVTILTRSIVPSGDEPQGRLYMKFDPVIVAGDGSPAVRLDITARGRPKEETTASALDLLDQQRRSVVKTFETVTSAEMHAVWGRVDAS
jgi:uncharacterized protein (TIGR04255 family)